jgi:hypothetical protein
LLTILLPLTHLFCSPTNRNDSVFVMTSTVILFASMALATMIGRSASKILHRIAAESFAQRPKQQPKNVSAIRAFAMSQLLTECEGGRFTALLNLVAEITGIFLVAPLWSLSISSERQAPFNGTCILFVSSLITFVLYVCSFALHLNSEGEFAPRPKDSCTDARWRRFLPFVCEVIVVSAGDMASLFEEANWSTTPLLGRDRSRTFSETSAITIADMVMERGDEASVGRKAL